jgi:homoserine dehydrogenase
MLAIGKKSGHTIEARVHPTFIAHDHPLASVRGSYNAVFLQGNTVGRLMLYGR